MVELKSVKVIHLLMTTGTPTTHYINTSVKLTMVTNLSFSERIAIATLSFLRMMKTEDRHSVWFFAAVATEWLITHRCYI